MSILCGNGGLYLPQEMMRGADGAMTGFSYPEELVETVRLHAVGQHDKAEDVFDCYIKSAATRAPGPRLSAADIAELDRLMARTEQRYRRLLS